MHVGGSWQRTTREYKRSNNGVLEESKYWVRGNFEVKNGGPEVQWEVFGVISGKLGKGEKA